MSVNIEVLHDRVLILPDKPEEKVTESGLVVPVNTSEKPQIGSVAGVGPEVRDVKSGDRVIFGKHDGQKLPVDGVTYLVLREEQVLGVICN